jgi:CRP-like cAMP-binding protein
MNDSKLNDSVEDDGKGKKEPDINKIPRPCFYTAVALTDCLVFSIPLDLIDKLPHDVFQTVKENLTQQKLDMLYNRLKFLHKQSHNFMKYQGKMKD